MSAIFIFFYCFQPDLLNCKVNKLYLMNCKMEAVHVTVRFEPFVCLVAVAATHFLVHAGLHTEGDASELFEVENVQLDCGQLAVVSPDSIQLIAADTQPSPPPVSHLPTPPPGQSPPPSPGQSPHQSVTPTSQSPHWSVTPTDQSPCWSPVSHLYNVSQGKIRYKIYIYHFIILLLFFYFVANLLFVRSCILWATILHVIFW